MTELISQRTTQLQQKNLHNRWLQLPWYRFLLLQYNNWPIRLLPITPAIPQTTYFNNWLAKKRIRLDYKRRWEALGYLSHQPKSLASKIRHNFYTIRNIIIYLRLYFISKRYINILVVNLRVWHLRPYFISKRLWAPALNTKNKTQ